MYHGPLLQLPPPTVMSTVEIVRLPPDRRTGRQRRLVPNPAAYPGSLLVAAIALLGTGPALAKSPPTVHLDYDRAPSASDCPDKPTVLDAVRARLGFDPFREPAEIAIHASVERRGEELRARIVLSAPSAQAGERLLVSHRSDCSELASVMDLALSIAIDPLSISREPAAPSPVVVFPVAVPSPPPVVEAPPTESPPPKFVEVDIGLAGNWGETVSPTAGLFAGAGIRSERWSLSLEGRADLPRSREIGGGRVEAGVLAGTLVPCLRRGILAGCFLATVAALRGSGQGLDDANRATTPLVALGARALVEIPRTGMVAFRAHLDLLSPLTRTTLKVGGEAVWTSPLVNAALGLAAVVRFR
jgi:hypothetical protein